MIIGAIYYFFREISCEKSLFFYILATLFSDAFYGPYHHILKIFLSSAVC